MIFLDTPLEQRCEALSAYVSTFETETQKTAAYRAGGCGEGNGLGGASYTFDFKVGDANHRLTLTWEEGGPVKVSVKPPREPLEQAVAQWAGAKPTVLRIYGKTYDEFVKGVLAYQGFYPILKKDKPATIKFKLVPDPDPKQGRVVFDGQGRRQLRRRLDRGRGHADRPNRNGVEVRVRRHALQPRERHALKGGPKVTRRCITSKSGPTPAPATKRKSTRSPSPPPAAHQGRRSFPRRSSPSSS
jgi:hypothetical protein